MSLNEKKTENIVREHFKSVNQLDDDKFVEIEEQKSDNPKIVKLLKKASKSGSGRGYPEFIISFPSPNSELVIIVECKADIKKHRSKTLDKYKDYAVDGVRLYSSHLSKDYDVISIAVSGISKNELKVSHFLQLKGSAKIDEFAGDQLLTFKNYLKLYLHDPDKEKRNYNAILEYSSDLNNSLRDLDLSESHRPILVSGILIALEDPSFRSSYFKEDRPSDLAKLLVNTIEKVLDKQNIQGFKKDNLKQSYGFIITHSKLANPRKKDGKFNTHLKDLIIEVEEKVFNFTKTYKYYDVIGKFYSEFLRYANGDKSLGIVLTPQHITDLFIELADINENTVALDNCSGTGGFLISAMKKMIHLAKGNESIERNIYDNQLIGVESQSNMFTLCCSNMMIRGDGRSNIYYGSCFEMMEEVKKHKPTVGLLNPPYSKKGDNLSEWDYILNNLECLEPNSICLAIIPISCVIDHHLKAKVLEEHTLEAVLSMPEDLFHDSDANTVTVIVILKAKNKHPENKKTWFGYCRNDGFQKVKNRGRMDSQDDWKLIKQKWLSAYQNKEEVKDFSIMRKVTASDEWCAEAYLETDYSELKEEHFVQQFKNYIAFKITNG